MAEHNDLGKLAEDLSADFLAKKGHKILARNFRFDIITVLPDKAGVLQITHIEDAFQVFDGG